MQQVVYSSSVDVRPEWVVKEQIPFTSLAKLHYQVGEPEDLAFCGKLHYYDKACDRVTPRLEKPLQKTNKAFRSVTTSDDPIIRWTALLHLHHSLTTSIIHKGGAVKMRLIIQHWQFMQPLLGYVMLAVAVPGL